MTHTDAPDLLQALKKSLQPRVDTDAADDFTEDLTVVFDGCGLEVGQFNTTDPDAALDQYASETGRDVSDHSAEVIQG